MAHARAQSENTALIYAAESGHVDCVRLLLDAGANANTKNLVCRSAASAVVVFW